MAGIKTRPPVSLVADGGEEGDGGLDGALSDHGDADVGRRCTRCTNESLTGRMTVREQ